MDLNYWTTGNSHFLGSTVNVTLFFTHTNRTAKKKEKPIQRILQISKNPSLSLKRLTPNRNAITTETQNFSFTIYCDFPFTLVISTNPKLLFHSCDFPFTRSHADTDLRFPHLTHSGMCFSSSLFRFLGCFCSSSPFLVISQTQWFLCVRKTHA